jgi:hypothetical protein
MKGHDQHPAFGGLIEEAPAAGDGFLGIEVNNRRPVQPIEDDGVQERIDGVNEHLALGADFQGQVAGSMTRCRPVRARARAHTYLLFAPGEEIVPAKGMGAGAVPVLESNCPPATPAPVAPSNRPVPPTTWNVSTLS